MNILFWVRSIGATLPSLWGGVSPWGMDTSMAGRSPRACKFSTVYNRREVGEGMRGSSNWWCINENSFTYIRAVHIHNLPHFQGTGGTGHSQWCLVGHDTTSRRAKSSSRGKATGPVVGVQGIIDSCDGSKGVLATVTKMMAGIMYVWVGRASCKLTNTLFIGETFSTQWQAIRNFKTAWEVKSISL